MSDATAELAAPAVIAAAVAGLVVARGRARPSVDWWALAAAGGVFAVYAAPVVLPGEATFPGYIKLDDDSTFLANLDRVMEHGRSLDGLEPSSYLATLQPHLAKGYPLGAVMPVGVGRDVVGGDSLWLYHPCVAFTAAMLALTLYGLLGSLVTRPWLRALAALVGAQSALLYGYALWGGLKEVAGAAAIALASALVWPALKSGRARAPSSRSPSPARGCSAYSARELFCGSCRRWGRRSASRSSRRPPVTVSGDRRLRGAHRRPVAAHARRGAVLPRQPHLRVRLPRESRPAAEGRPAGRDLARRRLSLRPGARGDDVCPRRAGRASPRREGSPGRFAGGCGRCPSTRPARSPAACSSFRS